jgi:hypothetical protein
LLSSWRNRRISSSVTDGLSEFFIVGVHRLNAGKVKNGPDQHGSVAIREDEPITVRPDRDPADQSA